MTIATSALRACMRKITQTSATMSTFLDQRALERIDGTIDWRRTVIDRFRTVNAFRKAQGDLRQTLFDAFDDGQRVLAVALERDA